MSIDKIHQHDAAANLLMMLADQEKDLINNCQISASESLDLLQPLHALIDEDIKAGPHIIATNLATNCKANCHCGIYSDLASNTIMKNLFFKKAQEMSRAELITCANKAAEWFCSSDLLVELRSEIRTINEVVPNAQ
ncbi:MAG: hypothetical protein Q7U04_12840 [Bacteriovorax sp.]|nr:hypothetical protein [Bacteriovorax sp.]